MSIDYSYLFYFIIVILGAIISFVGQVIAISALLSGLLILVQELIVKIDKTMNRKYTFKKMFVFMLKFVLIIYAIIVAISILFFIFIMFIKN